MNYLKDRNKPEEFTLGVLLLLPALTPYLSELDFSNSPVENIEFDEQFETIWIFFSVQTDNFCSEK